MPFYLRKSYAFPLVRQNCPAAPPPLDRHECYNKTMETSSIRSWVKHWKKTGEVLSELKLDEFRRTDPSKIFLSLTDASEAALIAYPPKPTSGLVEMQRIFKKLAEK